MAETCKHTITVRGQYTLAGYIAGVGSVVWGHRAKCSRKPKANGYCWQHQDVAAELERVARINRRRK